MNVQQRRYIDESLSRAMASNLPVESIEPMLRCDLIYLGFVKEGQACEASPFGWIEAA